jgi:hypothetical protein
MSIGLVKRMHLNLSSHKCNIEEWYAYTIWHIKYFLGAPCTAKPIILISLFNTYVVINKLK